MLKIVFITEISDFTVFSLYMSFQIHRISCNIHALEGYITFSCLLFTCLLRLPKSYATISHYSQGCLTLSCLLITCFLRLPSSVAAYSHSLQGHFNPSCYCLILKCLLRLPPKEFDKWSHLQQAYLTASWFLLICSFRQFEVVAK